MARAELPWSRGVCLTPTRASRPSLLQLIPHLLCLFMVFHAVTQRRHQREIPKRSSAEGIFGVASIHSEKLVYKMGIRTNRR